MTNYILWAITILAMLYIYKLINDNKSDTNNLEIDYANIKKYFIGQYSFSLGVFPKNKPVLWVYMHNDNTVIPKVNSRWWPDFMSRNTENFNQPYQILTIKSIIENNGQDFNVAVIDDSNISQILPDWNVDLETVAIPIRAHLRTLAKAYILRRYGGLMIPSSFICKKSFIDIWDRISCNNSKHCMCVGEFVNRTSSSDIKLFITDPMFLGCIQDCKLMTEYINFLQIIYSSDFVAQTDFLGQSNKWLQKAVNNDKMYLVPAEKLGCSNVRDKQVFIEDLINSRDIDFDIDAYGIYIPWDEIINKTAFQWFARLSPRQVLDSNTVIGKHLLAYS